MTKNKNIVWAVEMKGRKNWSSPIAVRLTRAEAITEKCQWIVRNPDDVFRVQKYTRDMVVRTMPEMKLLNVKKEDCTIETDIALDEPLLKILIGALERMERIQ